MAFPPITNLPAAPSRDQTPENFSSTADAFVAALPEFVTDVNAAGDYIDTKTVSVGNDFQGNYAAGTTYTTGQSVLYTDAAYYISLVDNNTGNAPDVSTSQWAVIGAGGGGGGRAIGELQYFSGAETVDYPEDKWLKCDGTVQLKATYQDLFNTLGLIVNGITSGDYDSGIADGAVGGGPSLSWGPVAYLDGYWYYAVGAYLLTTNDHTNWNVTSTGTNAANNQAHFIYDGTSIVAIHLGSFIYYTSNNGVSWSSNSPTITPYGLYALSFVNGTWVGRSLFTTVGYSSSISASTWSTTSVGTSETSWFSLQENGNYSVASDRTRLHYSTNGSSWSANNSFPFSQAPFMAMNASDNVIISDGNNLAYASGPSSNFNTVTNPLSGNIIRLGSLNNSDTFFICDAFGNVSTSTNGSSWSTPTYWGLNNGIGGVEETVKLYTDGSLYRVPCYAMGVWKRSTFSAGEWTSESNSMGSDIGYGANQAIWDGSQYVTTGRSNDPIAVSSDGETWTTKFHSNLPDFKRYSIAYDGSIYIAGCAQGNLVSSSNLTSWSTLTSNTSNEIVHVNYLNGTYLYITNTGEVGTTSNLATPFTVRSTGTSGDGKGSAYGNGKYVVTSGTTAAFSSDGVTWTQATVPSFSGFYSNVVWDGTQFVTGGQDGLVLTSTDGETWAIAFNSGQSGNSQIHSIVYYEGVYVAFDVGRRIFQGSDPSTLSVLTSGYGESTGVVVSDQSSEIIAMNGSGFKIPFYTYNTTTSFALPTQSATVSNGKQSLFIRAEQ
jgi:hypothetical protein